MDKEVNKPVCFVILHYGDIAVTERCMESIEKLDYKDKEVVLIDNDIKKTNEQRLELDNALKKYNYVHILRMQEDKGFSKPNNEGFKYVLDNYNPRYIIVCNNDIEFTQKDMVDRIDKVYAETNFSILGPDTIKTGTNIHQNPIDLRIRTYKEAKKTVILNRLALPIYDLIYPIIDKYFTNWSKQVSNNNDNNTKGYDIRQEDVVLFGACLIFSKNYFEKKNKCFDPETHFYYEEYILAYQCEKNHLKLVYDPSICVHHETNASTKQKHKNLKNVRKFIMNETAKSAQIYMHMLKEDNHE